MDDHLEMARLCQEISLIKGNYHNNIGGISCDKNEGHVLVTKYHKKIEVYKLND